MIKNLLSLFTLIITSSITNFLPNNQSIQLSSTIIPQAFAENIVFVSPPNYDPIDKAEELADDGLKALNQGRYQKAIALFEEAIAKNPNYARAYYNLGVTKEALEDFPGALADYTKAIELDPDNEAPRYIKEIAYQNRGLVRHELKDHLGAIADTNASIELNSDDGGKYANRGLAYAALEEYTMAIADHTKAIELEPNVPGWYFNRGKAYRQAGKYTESITDFNQAIKMNSHFSWAYFHRGHSYRKLGDYQKSEADYTRSLKTGYKPPRRVYYWRSQVRMELKNYRGAVIDLNYLIKVQPQDPEHYHNRAIANHHLGNFKLAKSDAIKSAELYLVEGDQQQHREMMNYASQFPF